MQRMLKKLHLLRGRSKNRENESHKDCGRKRSLRLKSGTMKPLQMTKLVLRIFKEMKLLNELMKGPNGIQGCSGVCVEVLEVRKRVKRILIGF